jgi:hypothetical protein
MAFTNPTGPSVLEQFCDTFAVIWGQTSSRFRTADNRVGAHFGLDLHLAGIDVMRFIKAAWTGCASPCQCGFRSRRNSIFSASYNVVVEVR